jgi:DNA repair protein RadC
MTKGKTSIKNPTDAVRLLDKYTRKRQEHFLVITLNGAHEVIKIHVASIGLVDKTIIHPRECFWHCIKDNAAALVFAHNHPSGKVFHRRKMMKYMTGC